MTFNPHPESGHPPAELDVAHSRVGVSVIAVRCELDILTAPALEQLFVQEFDGNCQGLVIDLSECGFLDSSGLAALLKAEEALVTLNL